MNYGKAISVILTEPEIAVICKKVNLEVENIIHQHKELLIDATLFLDLLETKLSIQSSMKKETQMRTFLAKPIHELLKSDKNKGVRLVVNGLNDSNLIRKLVREGQPLNMTYSLLLDETLIEYSCAREVLALLFRKQVRKEKFSHLIKKKNIE